MEAQEERLPRLGVAPDHVLGARAQKVREVPRLLDRHVVVPEIGLLIGARVRVVVDGAAAEPVEMVVAAQKRTEFRQAAEMPFADEGRAIASFPEKRRQRWLLGRQSDDSRGGQRLLQTDREAVLISAGDQRDAGGRADRRIGVRLQKTHAGRGETIDVRRSKVGPAVTGDVGVSEIVGEDEDDVGAARRLLRERAADARRERERPGCRLP